MNAIGKRRTSHIHQLLKLSHLLLTPRVIYWKQFLISWKYAEIKFYISDFQFLKIVLFGKQSSPQNLNYPSDTEINFFCWYINFQQAKKVMSTTCLTRFTEVPLNCVTLKCAPSNKLMRTFCKQICIWSWCCSQSGN